MIVVEIRLTIGSGEVVEETPSEEALSWSSYFLALTDEGCLASNRNLLLNAWNEASTAFSLLSHEAQDIIIDTIPNYSLSDDISHAKARYEVIRVNYAFNDFISGQSDLVDNNTNNEVTNNPSIIIAIITLGAFSIFMFFLFKKIKFTK